MELMDIINAILAILTGLSTCIPLMIQLVKYIKATIKERNFSNIMKLAIDLMPEAEEKFGTGPERKEYVMNNIKSLCATLDYEVDIDNVSEMIDAVIAISKKVNVNK
jgi:hypothetical protein